MKIFGVSLRNFRRISRNASRKNLNCSDEIRAIRPSISKGLGLTGLSELAEDIEP